MVREVLGLRCLQWQICRLKEKNSDVNTSTLYGVSNCQNVNMCKQGVITHQIQNRIGGCLSTRLDRGQLNRGCGNLAADALTHRRHPRGLAWA